MYECLIRTDFLHNVHPYRQLSEFILMMACKYIFRHSKTIFLTSHIVKTINRCITHNDKQALHNNLIIDKMYMHGWLILILHGNGKRDAMCHRNETARCINPVYCGEYIGYHITAQKFALEVKPVYSRYHIFKWRHGIPTQRSKRQIFPCILRLCLQILGVCPFVIILSLNCWLYIRKWDFIDNICFLYLFWAPCVVEKYSNYAVLTMQKWHLEGGQMQCTGSEPFIALYFWIENNIILSEDIFLNNTRLHWYEQRRGVETRLCWVM